MSGPKVYILVTTWDRWSSAVECLESVLRTTYRPYQIILCGAEEESARRIAAWARGDLAVPLPADHPAWRGDATPIPKPVSCVELDPAAAGGAGGSSTDARLVVIRFPQNRGYTGAVNAGLRYTAARGDAEHIWLLNDDTIVRNDALGALVGTIQQDPKTGLVASKVLHYDRPDVIQAAGGWRISRWQGQAYALGRNEKDNGQWDRPVKADYMGGTSLLARAEVVLQTGGLDEDLFLYWEDVDWCLRARKKGWRLAYCPPSRVWHKGGATTGHGSPSQDYYTVRNSLFIAARHYPAFVPSILLYSLFRCLLPKLCRFQFARARAVLRAYGHFLINRRGKGW